VTTPVSRRADRIADTLEEMVFTGQFQDGERLDETSLAAKFSVSRTPIREALQRLVESSLAEQRPRRGVFVRQPPSMAVVEMFETMAEIEGVCGRLAAQRATQNSIACLEAANEQCTRAIENANADAYSRHNEAFHYHIYSLAGNAFLEGEARRLFARLKPFRRIQFQMHERMSQSLADHKAIISAITIGDCDTTADILRRHIGSQGERFYQQMAVLRRTAANRNTT
jgi:DNA-binding GntR family transcriptional regulator